MTDFHLAPHVGLQYWRRVGRLCQVQRADQACFALLTVGADGTAPRISTQFELPAQGETLAIVLAAVNAAYSLGHHDRQNRICRAQGFERVTDGAIPQITRGHDDRA